MIIKYIFDEIKFEMYRTSEQHLKDLFVILMLKQSNVFAL
jgi:hypothetical protein